MSEQEQSERRVVQLSAVLEGVSRDTDAPKEPTISEEEDSGEE